MAIAVALVVEGPGAHEIELRAVIGKTVDLPVIELDGADGLASREAGEPAAAKPAVAAVLAVLVEPGGDR
jgi:hypothetical protein